MVIVQKDSERSLHYSWMHAFTWICVFFWRISQGVFCWESGNDAGVSHGGSGRGRAGERFRRRRGAQRRRRRETISGLHRRERNVVWRTLTNMENQYRLSC